jgi:hypothetical protein
MRLLSGLVPGAAMFSAAWLLSIAMVNPQLSYWKWFD